MTEGESLYRAILVAPGDAALRLVYADWLDEYGRPDDAARAEFIRVQVALAGLDERRCGGYYCDTGADGSTRHVDCKWWRLSRRETELLLETPSVVLLGARLPPATSVDFRGGLVGRVETTLDLFTRHAQSLFLAHPIAGVRLADREPSRIADAWTWEKLDRVRSVRHVPNRIFRHLAGGVGQSELRIQGTLVRHEVRAYERAADAHADLSDACVAYGRKLAGLPPL